MKYSILLGLLALIATVAGGCAEAEPAPTLTPAATALPTPAPTPTATSPSDTVIPLQQTPPSEIESVYLDERYRGRDFQSADEWGQKVREWQSRRPEFPGPLNAARGTIVGLQVSDQLNQDERILNDKWKHCVVGTEIALGTSLITSEYAAWSKEYQDLTDGRPTTGFDEDDYEATVDGARQAVQGQTCEESMDLCEERWGDRYKP